MPCRNVARHADELDRIRTDDRLRFLDRQLHPEWAHLEHAVGASAPDQPWLPDDAMSLRAAFYLCESIIRWLCRAAKRISARA